MPRRRFTILAALFVTVVINYLDRTNIAIAAIDLKRDLGLSQFQMGMIFSAFAWSYSLCQIPGGLVADRVRPRVLYPVLLTLWSVATMIQGLAGGLMLLIICRVLIGVFEAPSYPINNRVVTSWFPVSERAGAIAFYTSGQYLGLAILAPALVWFQAQFGWRALFYACGGLGIVWAWMWHVLYRDPDTDKKLDDDDRRALIEGGAAADWQAYGAGEGGGISWPSWGELREVLLHRKLWGIYLGQFCIGTVTIFFLTWFPTYLVESRGIAFERVGFLAMAPFLAALCGILLSGLASDWMTRRGVDPALARKGPVLLGILLSASMLGAIWVETDAAVVALMALAFFGNGMASITWVFVSLMAPERQLGLVGGVFNFIGGLSAVLTPMAVGFLIDGQDFSRALIYIGLVALGGVAAYTLLVGRVERITGAAHKE